MGEVQNRRLDSLLLALVLVAAHHAVPAWLGMMVYQRYALLLHRTLGIYAYDNLLDALSLLLPLLLCISSPRYYGLKIGDWTTHRWRLLAVTLAPVLAVVTCYRFTSQPFVGGRIGSWLISPAAQDMLFTGYLYVLLGSTFPGPALSKRATISKAVFITAVFFSLWHTPNFVGMSAPYVTFQLLYTFLFGLCFLSAREWTGSIIPGLLSHMACNLLAWIQW